MQRTGRSLSDYKSDIDSLYANTDNLLRSLESLVKTRFACWCGCVDDSCIVADTSKYISPVIIQVALLQKYVLFKCSINFSVSNVYR